MNVTCRVPPRRGETITFFTRSNLAVGQMIGLVYKGLPCGRAEVTASHADNPRYQNIPLTGGEKINTGEGYYEARVQ